MSTHGIDETIWNKILHVCFSSSKVKQVILYGSRARGNYKQGSDIDIAIDAPSMTPREFATLWNALDDLPIIYTLDVIHLQSQLNEQLLDEVDHHGVVFTKT